MKYVPQIRLRTVFLLFFCAAVGLATYRDSLGALEPAIATAMAIGLLQQSRQLWRWRPGTQQNDFAFARQFALFWRVCLAAILGACVVTELFQRNGWLFVNDEQRVTWYKSVLWPVLPISTTVVLCNSVLRWRGGLIAGTTSPRRSRLAWLITTALGLLVIVHGSLIVFLIHEGLAGMEASTPARFQRPNVYPNLGDEGFRLFWLAAAAIASLTVSGFVLLRFGWPPDTPKKRTATAGATLLLIVPVSFCGWYYSSEFHRISPELAGAGLEANTTKWLVGSALAVGLVTAAAYQLARTNQSSEPISNDMSIGTDSQSLHESAPLLFLIAVHAVHVSVSHIKSLAEVSSVFPKQRVWLFFSPGWWNSADVLVLSQVAASVLLCWMRVRRCSEPVPWALTELPRPVFFHRWLMVALLLAIAVPTLNAFGFIAWLGPFKVRRLLFGV